MYQSNIKTSQHKWDKKNLVTIGRGGRMFDEMVCINCGMKGKRYGFDTVEVSENYKIDNAHFCPKALPVELPKKVKVTQCTAQGKAFANLIPESVHEVVIPPYNYKNDHTGVWVMGVGEPVKLMPNEYVEVA